MTASPQRFSILQPLAMLAVIVLMASGCISVEHLPGNNFSAGNSDSLESLKPYPGSVESEEYVSWASITGLSSQFSEFHAYTSNANEDEIFDWYMKQLPTYELSNKEMVDIGGINVSVMTLKSGYSTVGIMAFESNESTIYLVGISYVKEDDEELPSHDMANGEEPLQRYPGAVMLVYSRSGMFPVDYEITYGTTDSYDKVSKWFKTFLLSNGWNMTYQSAGSDTIELVFEKDDDYATIWVGAPDDERKYTEITVSYTKREIPDHDLEKGWEPIKRYPGAVIIDYKNSSMTIQGMTSFEVKVTYLAPENLESVRQWYAKRLREMFTDIYMDKYSIDAGATEQYPPSSVHIDLEPHNTYTEISIDFISGQ